MADDRASKRSIFVASMSRAAGLWLGVAGAASALIAACNGAQSPGAKPVPTTEQPSASATSAATSAATGTASSTAATTASATAAPPATTSEPPPVVAKYGGPPPPIMTKYGGPPRPLPVTDDPH